MLGIFEFFLEILGTFRNCRDFLRFFEIFRNFWDF